MGETSELGGSNFLTAADQAAVSAPSLLAAQQEQQARWGGLGKGLAPCLGLRMRRLECRANPAKQRGALFRGHRPAPVPPLSLLTHPLTHPPQRPPQQVLSGHGKRKSRGSEMGEVADTDDIIMRGRGSEGAVPGPASPPLLRQAPRLRLLLPHSAALQREKLELGDVC